LCFCTNIFFVQIYLELELENKKQEI